MLYGESLCRLKPVVKFAAGIGEFVEKVSYPLGYAYRLVVHITQLAVVSVKF